MPTTIPTVQPMASRVAWAPGLPCGAPCGDTAGGAREHPRSAGRPRGEHGGRRARKGPGRTGPLRWTPSSAAASWRVPGEPRPCAPSAVPGGTATARHLPGQLPGDSPPPHVGGAPRAPSLSCSPSSSCPSLLLAAPAGPSSEFPSPGTGRRDDWGT